MRVLMNGIPLLSSHCGVGTYIYQLSTALAGISTQLEMLYFYGSSFANKMKTGKVSSFRNVRKASNRVHVLYRALHFAKELSFKWRLPSQKIDVYHETNYIPMPFRGPTVVSVFDLSLHLWPQTHPKNRRDYFKRHFYRRLPWASHFIVISEATKAQMIEYLNISPDKITVTHLGVSPNITPIPAENAKRVMSHYGLTYGSYLLYVGTLEPRKNITALLQAYALMPKRTQSCFPLILAGGRGWLMDHIEDEINRLGIASTTRITGYVLSKHLPALYSGAKVFIYPSLYEGFGLPPLEAMACGTPVITSNVSSLPEVVGDAGILIDPHDINRLKSEIEHLIEDSSQRNLLRNLGLERSKQFTWEACARKTLDAYSYALHV